MTEQHSSPNPDSASVAQAASDTSPVASPPPAKRRRWLEIGLLLLAVLLLLEWWSASSSVANLRRELAQRLLSGDTLNTQTKLIANRVDEEVKVLQGKVSLLEARQAESQGQQAALEQLYQDLAKNRDDWAIAEVEQVLSTASQQLQLAGNVRGALIALQNADNRLARTDRPQFIAIRRAIAKDIENIKSLPSVDLTGTAVRIDALVAQIDTLPLLADEKPAVIGPSPKSQLAQVKRDAKSATTQDDWRSTLNGYWQGWTSDMWREIQQLVRVRSVNTPEALLLSPGEAFFARENLKLRLLNARLALLSRNDTAFRADLNEADRALQRYFDTKVRQTQAAREVIKQLQANVLSIDMPTLSNSLAALQHSRPRP